jgi:HAD superfamily phosphatase
MHVLFDMDGVLVDVSGSYRRAVIETTAALSGRVVSPATVQAYKDRGGFNNDWVLTHALVREAGVEIAYEDVIEAFDQRYRGRDFDGYIAEEPPLVRTGTLARLAERGDLALVTGRTEGDARWTLERFGWDRYFPVVVAMEQQAGREKPDPYPLTLALDALGQRLGEPLDPARAVYAGDTVDDVRAALAAGVRPVGIVPPYLDAAAHRRTLVSAGAEVVLDDVNALGDAIRALR